MNTCKNNKGFTLVEALVAMFILSIGILTLITMQTTSIKGNAKARNLTVATNWGQDRIEKLFAMDFDEPDKAGPALCSAVVGISDRDGDQAAGLDDATKATADYWCDSPDGHYTIYWNVEENILSSTPDSPLKQITVSIVRKDFGNERTVAFNYYKQRIY